MDEKELLETPVWRLFEKGRNYHRQVGIFTDTDRNHRFYNGDQWAGAKLGGVEPVQQNFIKPIVKYKISVVHDNLYAINYSSQNYENRAFRETAERIIKMLNRYAASVWEKDKMDFKGRRVTRDAAINSEGIIWVDFDTEAMMPVNEIIEKNDVFYGDENVDDIQRQPYILIRRRLAQTEAQALAKEMGVKKDEIEMIIPDNDVSENSGEAGKLEVDDKCTLVYKFYKLNGTVHFDISSRVVTIAQEKNMGLTVYPIAHLVWEEKKGSARGEGEVRNLIPNQIEVNKTLMRRAVTVKGQAFPQKVADVRRIQNPEALDTVGGTIKTQGQTVDDVRKIVGTITPAQMSPDVKQLQDDLINVTRELAGAGDVATGQVNPESASGKAILAVQQASQAPMAEQKEIYKNFVEDLARIWLEYLTVHAKNGVAMEEEVTDPQTGQESVTIVTIPQVALEALKATVKIDITPKSVYDRFAQEQTIENFLIQGFFNGQRLSELKIYAKTLDDDAVAPKQKLLKIVDEMEKEQLKIAQIQAQAQQLQQRAMGQLDKDMAGHLPPMGQPGTMPAM